VRKTLEGFSPGNQDTEVTDWVEWTSVLIRVASNFAGTVDRARKLTLSKKHKVDDYQIIGKGERRVSRDICTKTTL